MASSFNVLDFYNVASFLIVCEKKEESAFIRTAIGRVYYSVFLTLRDKAKNTKWYKENRDYSGAGGYHKQLLAFFEKPVNDIIEKGDGKIFFEISIHLKKLQELRTKSDYEREEITIKNFETAKSLFESLRAKVQGSDWGF